MPRRPAGSRVGGRAAKRRPRRRRLYVVTEDLVNGYSMHKVDLEEDYGVADADTEEEQQQQEEERRLPPVVLRLEATNDGHRHFVAAFGTKIVALHQTPRRYIPVFDVRTRCMSFGPRMPLSPIAPVYVPLGDKLFSLDSGDLQMLTAPPPPMDPCVPNFSDSVPKWSKWRRLPIPPFNNYFITCHAVHPDGRTIFVSLDVEGRDAGDTFTFDTGARTPKWRVHHGWQLPFKGTAYYDRELDAWVGLAGDPATLGHLCACQAPSTAVAGVSWQAPSWKLSKEKLFCQDPVEKHTGATLVYLGAGYRSNFCLVQCLSHHDRRLLRLTTFSLKYDKDGDLRTSTHRRVRSFKLPKAVREDSAFLTNPMAFWL